MRRWVSFQRSSLPGRIVLGVRACARRKAWSTPLVAVGRIETAMIDRVATSIRIVSCILTRLPSESRTRMSQGELSICVSCPGRNRLAVPKGRFGVFAAVRRVLAEPVVYLPFVRKLAYR